MPNEKPVHEVRLGRVKAAVWKNETAKGVRYNTTFSRIYVNDDEEWRNAQSFGRDDLLVLGKVADRAHSWIHDQKEPRTPTVNRPTPRARKGTEGERS